MPETASAVELSSGVGVLFAVPTYEIATATDFAQTYFEQAALTAPMNIGSNPYPGISVIPGVNFQEDFDQY